VFKRLTAVLAVTMLVAVPAALAAGTPQAMVLKLVDVQSVPDQSGFGNLADGFVAKKAKARVIKSKKFGRIRAYEAAFQNDSVPEGYSATTLRLVSINSEAYVYASPALAEAHWRQFVAHYDDSPAFVAFGRPKVGKEARLYSIDLGVTGLGFNQFVYWRWKNVVGRLSVDKSSDVEFDGLAWGYVVRLAKEQQARIARASL
jgi:hypothetical protein